MTKRPHSERSGGPTKQHGFSSASDSISRDHKRQKLDSSLPAKNYTNCTQPQPQIPILPFPSPQGYPVIKTDGLSPALLELAFTHQGFHKSSNHPQGNYERLEFYGDAVMQMISTEVIYHRFPHLPVGTISSLREILVCNKNICRYSRAYGFPERLRAPHDTAKKLLDAGGDNSKSAIKLHADLFEAFLGAIVVSPSRTDPSSHDPLWTGMQRARELLESLWEPQIRKFDEKFPRPSDFKENSNMLATSPDDTGDRSLTTTEINIAAKNTIQGRLMYKSFIELSYAVSGPKTQDPLLPARWLFHRELHLTGWGYENLLLGVGAGATVVDADAQAAQDALNDRSGLMKQIVERRADFLAVAKEAKEKGEDLKVVYNKWIRQFDDEQH